MKRIFRLFLTLFLFASVLFTCIPVHATERTCGENATWSLDESTGTLTISGYGAIDVNSRAPWHGFRDKIYHIVISEGITSIGHSAFSHLSSAQTVSFPSTLQSIEDSAFFYCTSLQSPTFNSSLSYIGARAFEQCSSITALSIPSGVTTISSSAFSHCYSLQSLTLHDNITYIGRYAFSNCHALTTLTIPDSVTEIDGFAFRNCGSLQTVTLGNGLKTIGEGAFNACKQMQRIHIPDSVTSIGNYAFGDCSALSEVNIGSGVSSIKVTAFNGCSSLTAFTVSSDNPYLSTDHGALYTKNKTELLIMPYGYSGSYTVPFSCKTIGAYACYRRPGLISIHIPGSVTTISEYAFSECPNLTSVQLSNGLQTIGEYAFAYCPFSSITFPGTLIKIDELAFSHCSNMTTMYFTGFAPDISASAFVFVEATAYYPENHFGWANSQKHYGGHLKWMTINCGGNHQPVILPAKEATCTQTGLTAGSSCSVCGEFLAAQKTIPATGHSFSQWATVHAPSDDAEGKAERTCSVCKTTEQKTLPNLESSTATTPSTPEQGTTPPVGTEPTETDIPAATGPKTQTSDSGQTDLALPIIIGFAFLGAGCSVIVYHIRKRKT